MTTNVPDGGHNAASENLLDFLKSTLNGMEGKIVNGEEKITLGDLFTALHERAFGMLLFLLAAPCCLPFVYILPQIVALPMLLLAGQMAAGRDAPWLPSSLANRDFPKASMLDTVSRMDKYLGWLGAITHKRLPAITGEMGSRVVGALLLIPTASILVPLPLTNTIPGFGVAVAAFGLIERDGLLVILGLLIGLGWVLLLLTGGLAVLSALVSLLQ